MPTRRTRRRKSRKGKPSSRKKSTARKRSRRCVAANALSSDDDYVLESDGEDNSSDTDQKSSSSADEENEQEREGKEEEEEVEEDCSSDAKNDERNSYRRARSGAPKHRRCSRHKRNSSDEDFNVNLERDSSDDGCAGEGPSDPRSARACDANTEHTASQRQKRQKRCKQDSSDEDFEMTVEESLNSGDWTEGCVAARPITRAMEAGHVTDSSTEGLILYPAKLEGRNASLDALPKSNLKRGEPSHSINSSSARGGSTIDKDTAADKKKGKEKVLEGEKATASQLTLGITVSGIDVAATSVVVCGICLNETATIERGKLDCCDHFFCFGCIMEWAKVESRCPMCKQRFATVAKAGSSMSKRTRTVRIPLRDQVYVPPEDDLPFEDPYADVICMECHGIGDEGLLLLCDRCDSAAHTFCVGLGRSVPRGDWYCRDCQALVGENSGSESEAEELVLASDSGEEDEEFLVRSIVASESRPTRQRRVQRVPGATTGPPSRPRRRLGSGGRRIWRRLLSRRGRGRRVATAPQLSQTARAFLLSGTSELTPVTPVSETPQSGSARTVPQQRRLQERIIAMRNNWGRIQNGDVQFDAIRTPSAESVRPSSGTAELTSATGFTADNRVESDFVEIPPQGDKDLKRAWRMMGQARNLSAGTSNSGMHQQRSILSHHTPTPPCPLQIFQAAASTNVGTSSVPCINIDRPTHDAFCQSSESSDVGTRRAIKERPHVSSVRGKEFTVPPVLTAENRKERKQDHTCSLTPTKCPIDSCSMSQQLTGGKIAADAVNTRDKGEKNAFFTEMEPQGIKLQRNYLGRTHIDTGIGTGKSGLSHAKESNGAKSYCSPPHEGLKVHLIELVKKQTWPVYIAERLDKEQFKRIARAAVHSLLAVCENNKSLSLSCSHFEDKGKDPIVNCCTKCLDQHVENAVRTAKDKIVPR
ncbi:hypothetical protein L7F22_059574 [Adiantum nelumboides]|nr:hypothetical protein [Adiantum nelumboides]